MRAAAETHRGVAGPEQPVYDREAELARQLEAERQKAQEAQAKLDRQRAQANARKRRWRERHGEQARQQNIAYLRAWRARKRGQGS